MQLLIKCGLILLVYFATYFSVNSFPVQNFVIAGLDNDEPLNCSICKVAGFLIEQVAQLNESKELIVEILVDACIQIKHENPTICHGIVEAYADELDWVFAHSVLKPECFCTILFNYCPGDCFDPSAEWNVTLPDVPKPPVQPPLRPPNDAPKLRILHLTDLHFDPKYTEGSEANCDDPLCCRSNVTGLPTASDVNLVQVYLGLEKQPAGRWGTIGKCDTPLRTLDLLFKHLNESSDQFDIIYWTGDITAHADYEQNREYKLEVLHQVIGMFKEYLPKKLVLPAIGNHEGEPTDSFPPHYIDLPEDYSLDWLYKALVEEWSEWINDARNIRRMGSYSLQIQPGFRVISINDNYCKQENFWVYVNPKDPDGLLAWLVAELQKAENAGEKVHIIGHVPTGGSDCMQWWSWNYYNVINRYESTVRGQFFGHTHSDQFILFYENANSSARVTNVMTVSPSITPNYFRNPAYKIFTIDQLSWAILKHEVYYLDLTKANSMPEEIDPNWEFEYDTKSAYKMDSCFPEDYANLLNEMKVGIYLNDYVGFKISTPGPKPCDSTCRQSELCQIQSGRSHDPQLCANI